MPFIDPNPLGRPGAGGGGFLSRGAGAPFGGLPTPAPGFGQENPLVQILRFLQQQGGRPQFGPLGSAGSPPVASGSVPAQQGPPVALGAPAAPQGAVGAPAASRGGLAQLLQMLATQQQSAPLGGQDAARNAALQRSRI